MHKAATRVFWALWSFPKSYMKAVKCEITWSFLGCRSDFLVICYSALLRPHSPIIFFSARYYLSWPSLMNNRIGLYIQIGMRKSKKVMKKMTKAQSKSLRKLFLYFHFSKVGVEECICWGKGSEWFGNSDAKEHKLGETGGGKKKKVQWQRDVPEKSQDRISVGMSEEKVRDPSLTWRVVTLQAVTVLAKSRFWHVLVWIICTSIYLILEKAIHLVQWNQSRCYLFGNGNWIDRYGQFLDSQKTVSIK